MMPVAKRDGLFRAGITVSPRQRLAQLAPLSQLLARRLRDGFQTAARWFQDRWFADPKLFSPRWKTTLPRGQKILFGQATVGEAVALSG
jgi:hypothetical protein